MADFFFHSGTNLILLKIHIRLCYTYITISKRSAKILNVHVNIR